MRIPIPERFPPRKAAVFIAFLFAGQQMQGTDLFFSLLTALFVALWVAAFNLAGGLEYTSGAFIFFNGLFTVVVGLTTKVLLWEKGDGNLQSPRSDMICYCLLMGGIAAAAFVNRSLRRRQPLFKDFPSLAALKQASFFSLVIGFSIFVGLAGAKAGGLASIVFQLNRLPMAAILFAVTYEVRHSGGKRSLNWIGVTAILINTFFGIIYFSKEGMLLGGTAWVLAAMLSGFSFSRIQIIGTVLGAAFMVYYLVPYSQYVRIVAGTTRAENIAISLKYLSNLNETRRLYLDVEGQYDLAEESHLFDQRLGFLDRLIMFAPDDNLIHYTDQGNIYGLFPTFAYHVNVLPHFIYKDKPAVGFGNVYAHELGIVAEEDYTTGISFSPVSDYYHEAKWLGLLLLAPVEMFLAFFVMDSLVGSTRQAPWALLLIIEVSHSASEGGAGAAIDLYTTSLVSMLFVYWTLTRGVPFVLSVASRNSQSVPLQMPAQENS